ncbi:hypothetical protein [Dyella acidisoli]|uniref:Uncharacterized protein n=1 Tax=Dyella acidisoli TaxID=1867834 RepID=A0ABQ5XQ06_9GAMM|nr:hypothetical protein [Dyella acidisoli]GLQ93462.1 hypothetical protein GCM10007901_24130 [Dyella acidisoli]
MTLVRQVLLGAGLLGALWLYHVVTTQRIALAEARADAATTAQRDLTGQLAAVRASEHIVTRYVDRVRVVQERGATLTKEIPVYVTAQADAACSVPVGFVRVHDAAAANELPGPAGTLDAQPSGVALSAVAGTVVDNYATCHAAIEQLKALQAWVRANQAAP